MKSFISLLFVSSILLTSCKNDTESKNNSTPTNVVPFTVVGNQMKAESTAGQQSGTSNTTTTNAVTSGLNPAHGQPGHICEIPVGAPLNTAVAANNQQNVTTAAPTVTTTPTPTATIPVEQVATAEGMNPPHGQANHRCDIAVGAPLPKV